MKYNWIIPAAKHMMNALFNPNNAPDNTFKNIVPFFYKMFEKKKEYLELKMFEEIYKMQEL